MNEKKVGILQVKRSIDFLFNYDLAGELVRKVSDVYVIVIQNFFYIFICSQVCISWALSQDYWKLWQFVYCCWKFMCLTLCFKRIN